MTRTHAVQWSDRADQLDRGPRTGPLTQDAAQHLAASLRRMAQPPAAVRVVCVVPRATPLSLFGAHR